MCPPWVALTSVEATIAAAGTRKKYIIGTLVYVLVMKLEARLRAFAAFARQRSFSAAAAELRISQPAVSKHIAELEEALELKLVKRSKRDGALTEAGDFIANHMLRAESLLMQAGLGAAEFRKSGAGSVSVVASSLTGVYLLPDIIAEFQHSHPDVRVTLQALPNKQSNCFGRIAPSLVLSPGRSRRLRSKPHPCLSMTCRSSASQPSCPSVRRGIASKR